MKMQRRNYQAAKLSVGQIVEIRERWAAGGVTQSELCREYQVSVGQIGRIVRGESWQGIARPPTKEEQAAQIARLFAVQAEVNNKPNPIEVSVQDKLTSDITRQRARELLGETLVEELKSGPVNPLDE